MKLIWVLALSCVMMAGCQAPTEDTTSVATDPPATTDTSTTSTPDDSTGTMTEDTKTPDTTTDAAGEGQDRKPKDGEEVAVIETSQGKIVVMFFPEVAPKHVENFKSLAKKGFYDGTRFHRVIPGFMIQGGDPNSKNDNRADDGTGGPGHTVVAEFNKYKHVRGILSAARSQDPNSAGSQFFIMHAAYPSLDNNYSIFGRAVTGLEVVDKIVMLDKDGNDNPNDNEASRVKKITLAKWPVK